VTEEQINVQILLNLLAEAFGCEDRVWHRGMDEMIRHESNLECPALGDLLTGKRNSLAFDCYDPFDIVAVPDAKHSGLIFPGSFNPYHTGHDGMGEIAVDMIGKDLEYEIAIRNVSKPNLDLITLQQRLAQFTGRGNSHGPTRVWVTTEPTFVGKSNLFPGATFVVGYDTAARICDAKYAGPLDKVFETFRANNTAFLVFGRTIEGTYRNDITTFPVEFQQMAITDSVHRHFAGVSSSEIRRTAING
jgi:hypothetical protein